MKMVQNGAQRKGGAANSNGRPLRPIPGGKPATARKVFSLSDTGNAERLAFYYGARIRYVPAWDTFYVHVGTHWQPDVRHVHLGRFTKRVIDRIEQTSDAPTETAAKWKAKSRDRARREAMIALLRSEPGIAIEHTAFDRDPYLLNAKNGTLDARTGVLREHRAEDLITCVIPYEYDPNAKAPQWERFLSQQVPDPGVRTFLQRDAGYNATGDVTERILVMLLGAGLNGKSVFLRIMKSALGPYACAAMPKLLMRRKHEAHDTEVADLFGKRLAIASEVRKGSSFDEEQLKRLTGNDPLKARRMREDPWEFEPTFKLLIAANHRPRVHDASDSIWDRIALVPFDVRVKKVDRQLVRKLLAELPGVLAWIVRGAVDWHKHGLQIPKAIKEATESYRAEQDIAGRFLREACVFEREAFASTTTLMEGAKRWCTSQDLFAFTRNELEEHLVERGCQRHRTKVANGWKGIRLKTPPKSPEKPGGGGGGGGGQIRLSAKAKPRFGRGMETGSTASTGSTRRIGGGS